MQNHAEKSVCCMLCKSAVAMDGKRNGDRKAPVFVMFKTNVMYIFAFFFLI